MSNWTEKFYDFIAIFYPIIDIFLKTQKKRMVREVNDFPFGHVLEIGVGNGGHLHLYKSHCITGVDISSRMLSYAKKRKLENISLLKMNGEALKFQNEYFNYIVLSHIIAVVDKPEELLEEAFRVLKPSRKANYSQSFYSQ